jgi:preprotein translocase subunit SecD
VQARQTIERRVNELGVTERAIAQQGTSGDQILVQLPGVTDVNRAKEIIRSTGLLELKIVEQGPSAKDALLVNGQVPQGMEVVPGVTGTPGDAGTVYYLVKKAAAVTGTDLRNARPSVDENNQPAVAFTLSNEGGNKFGKVTSENIGRQLAIILDGRVQSAPRIESRIQSEGRITGSFTTEEVQNLALILRSGALSASLTYLEERTIGPSLGADSIRSGVIASLVGLLLVIAFMLIYYKLSGVNAVVALVLNLVILLGPDGLHRRGDDAARHCRLRADDGDGRRFERAHLRAHQGRARGRDAASAPRSTPDSAASSGRWSTPTRRR